MIIDKSDGKLDEIRKFAEQRGLTDHLQKKLDQLDSKTYFGKPVDVILVNDFAPYSLIFYLITKGKGNDSPWKKEDVFMYGGFIYHGNGDNGAGMPTLSVKIGDLSEGWSVHT